MLPKTLVTTCGILLGETNSSLTNGTGWLLLVFNDFGCVLSIDLETEPRRLHNCSKCVEHSCNYS